MRAQPASEECPAPAEGGPTRRPEVVRLAPAANSVEVVLLDGASWSATRRPPHRHDYHELIFLRSGSGVHELDGRRVDARAGTVTLIGRGQVHVFAEACEVHGAVVRFDATLLFAGARERAVPTWLLSGRGSQTVRVPAGALPQVDATLRALAVEAATL